MKKYYAIKKQGNKEELLEEMTAKNLTEARRAATQKYLTSVVLSGTAQLVVVGEAGYKEYHR